MADIETRLHSAYHLAELVDDDNVALYQPVRQNNFRFVLQPNENLVKNGFVKPGHDQEESQWVVKSTDAVDVLDFSVVSFAAPHFTQEEIPIKKNNSTIYFAGVPTFEAGSLVINDFYGADGKSILLAWQALSYDVNNDSIPNASNYKMNGVVYEYLPDGQLVRYWELKGCWIRGLSEDGWNAESGSKKTVTATIRFDRAIPHTGE